MMRTQTRGLSLLRAHIDGKHNGSARALCTVLGFDYSRMGRLLGGAEAKAGEIARFFQACGIPHRAWGEVQS
jgi:hypothetical protein